MADKKISALTAASTPLAGSEVLPIVQGGSTVKVSVSDLTAGRQVNASRVAAGGITNLATIGSPSIGSIGGTAYDGNFTLAAANLSNATNQSGVQIGWNTANKNGIIASGYGDGVAGLEFWNFDGVGWANQVTFTQTGNIAIKVAGKGIDFSATTHAAGMTSELLNDYEEGTWTPTVAGFGSPTYSVQNGEYTKVGNLVHITGKLSFSGASGASAVSIGGLPYASADANDLFQRASCFVEGDWAGAALFITSYGMFRANGTSLQGVKNSAGSSALALASDFSATVSFNFSLTYYV